MRKELFIAQYTEAGMSKPNVLLAKIEGADLKYKRSLHKPWCRENKAKRLRVSDWWGCSGCNGKRSQP